MLHIEQRYNKKLRVNDPLTNEILDDVTVTSDEVLKSNVQKAIKKILDKMSS